MGGNEKWTSCTNRHVSVLQQSHKIKIKAIILKQKNSPFSLSLIMRCTEAQSHPPLRSGCAHAFRRVLTEDDKMGWACRTHEKEDTCTYYFVSQAWDEATCKTQA